MSKPKKLVTEKNLSGLGGVKDVSFGDAPPERRSQGDYSKAGVSHVDSDTFDDYTERNERYVKSIAGL